MPAAVLNAKQKEFAHHYSASHNATQAAVAAGYSERRARDTGSELLRKPDVAALVSELDAEKRGAQSPMVPVLASIQGPWASMAKRSAMKAT